MFLLVLFFVFFSFRSTWCLWGTAWTLRCLYSCQFFHGRICQWWWCWWCRVITERSGADVGTAVGRAGAAPEVSCGPQLGASFLFPSSYTITQFLDDAVSTIIFILSQWCNIGRGCSPRPILCHRDTINIMLDKAVSNSMFYCTPLNQWQCRICAEGLILSVVYVGGWWPEGVFVQWWGVAPFSPSVSPVSSGSPSFQLLGSRS